MDRQYSGRNCDKFRKLLIIFGMTIRVTEKIVKCPISTCTTLRNDDVIVTSLEMQFSQEETPEFILPLLWPPNSPTLNAVD